MLSIIDGVTVLRSGDGTAQTSFGYTYTITFIGPVLSNGNQNELTIEKAGCESWSSSGSHVTMVETLVEGVVGAVQEVAEVVTTGSNSMTGGFYLSTDFEGDMNVIGLQNVSVQQESRIVTTSVDLTSILYPGDYVRIESEVFRVHATATHSPNQIILDREYPLGDSAVATLYLMDTVACHSTAINANAVTVTALHCDAHFEAGDYFAINGKQYTVHSVSNTTIVSTTAITYEGQRYTIYKRKRASIAYDESADSMKAKLEALPGIGSVDVKRTGPDHNDGYVWTITFTSFLGKTQCTDAGSACLVAESDRSSLSLTNGAAAVVHYTSWYFARHSQIPPHKLLTTQCMKSKKLK